MHQTSWQYIVHLLKWCAQTFRIVQCSSPFECVENYIQDRSHLNNKTNEKFGKPLNFFANFFGQYSWSNGIEKTAPPVWEIVPFLLLQGEIVSNFWSFLCNCLFFIQHRTQYFLGEPWPGPGSIFLPNKLRIGSTCPWGHWTGQMAVKCHTLE